MQTGTRIPPVPPQVRFQAVSGHSSHFEFQQSSAGTQILTGTRFSLLFIKNKKIKKIVKVQMTPFWTLLKDLISDSQIYSFLSFFHSQIPHSLPSCSLWSLYAYCVVLSHFIGSVLCSLSLSYSSASDSLILLN